MQKNYTKTTARAWHIICYDKQIVDAICEKSTRYAYILHDRDTYTEDTEKHKKGDKKPPHYHLYCYRRNDTLGEFFIKIGKKFSDNAGAVQVAPQSSGADAVRYFQHADDASREAGKTPYSFTDIIFDDKGFDKHFKSLEQIQAEKEEKTASEEANNIAFLSDLIVHRNNPYQMVKRYGRSYIMHRAEMATFAQELLDDVRLPIDELSEEAQAEIIEYRSQKYADLKKVPDFQAGHALLQLRGNYSTLRLMEDAGEIALAHQARMRIFDLKRTLELLAHDIGINPKTDTSTYVEWLSISETSYRDTYGLPMSDHVNPYFAELTKQGE